MSLAKLTSAFASHDRAVLEQSVDRALLTIENELSETAPPLLFNILTAAGRATASTFRKPKKAVDLSAAKSKPSIHFSNTNPQAIAWARTQSAQLVTDITNETRSSIQEIMARSFSEKFPPAQSARLLREVVSLNLRQAKALANFQVAVVNNPGKIVQAGSLRIRVPEGGMSKAKLDSYMMRYAEKLQRNRAMMIARTETMGAANEGQRQLWLQARDNGLLTGKERRVWIAGDPCDDCRPFEDMTAPLTSPFQGGPMNPPLHPMCRCTTGLVL